MAASQEPEMMLVETVADWRSWLEAHHASSTGILMRLAKTKSSLKSITYQEALEVSLCYGWIDARKTGLDADSYTQRFVPRKKGSIWSKINREKAEKLIAEGKMLAPGFTAIDAAKESGQWDGAYEGQATVQVPPDLVSALAARPAAKAFFESLGSVNRYAILHRLQTAKKPETRQARFDKFLGMLERGEKLHPTMK